MEERERESCASTAGSAPPQKNQIASRGGEAGESGNAKDGPLVFELVWHCAIHPAYLQRKRRYADELHADVCKSLTRKAKNPEESVRGMMDVLEFLSCSLLLEYGFATPWYMRDRTDAYYPLRVRGLDLANHPSRHYHDSNPLGGYRV